MGFIDNIKDTLHKIKIWIISLKDKLPFGKRSQLGSGDAHVGPVKRAEQPGGGYQIQEHSKIAGAEVPQAGTAMLPQSVSPAHEVLPAGTPLENEGGATHQDAQPNPQTQPETSQQIEPAAVKLLKYIRQYRQQGHTDEQILKFLMQHKWPEDIVRKALEFR